jgi:hypothetical protein
LIVEASQSQYRDPKSNKNNKNSVSLSPNSTSILPRPKLMSKLEQIEKRIMAERAQAMNFINDEKKIFKD